MAFSLPRRRKEPAPARCLSGIMNQAICKHKRGGMIGAVDRGELSWRETKSGRQDSNLRLHGPKPCALAKLSYAPRSDFRLRLFDRRQRRGITIAAFIDG